MRFHHPESLSLSNPHFPRELDTWTKWKVQIKLSSMFLHMFVVTTQLNDKNSYSDPLKDFEQVFPSSFFFTLFHKWSSIDPLLLL